jgi:hypothetical protein
LKKSRRFADYLGITSAFVCLLHCLATPVLLWAGTYAHAHPVHVHVHETAAAGTHEAWWHVFLHHGWDFLFLGLGLIAVWQAAKHASGPIRGLLWAAFVFLAGAILLEHYADLFRYLAYGASVLLIGLHLYNLRHTFRRPACEHC